MRNHAAISRSFSVLLAASLLAACAGRNTDFDRDRVPFSEELIAENHLDSGQRARLQYYLSDTITLTREIGNGQVNVARGKLLSRSGTLFEEVKIPAGAPGVVVASGPGWVAVSFVPDSYLYFVSGEGATGWFGHREPDQYYPFSRDFDGRTGTVKLDGVAYQADRASLDAYLLIDREDFSRVDKRDAVLPGRWLVEGRY